MGGLSDEHVVSMLWQVTDRGPYRVSVLVSVTLHDGRALLGGILNRWDFRGEEGSPSKMPSLFFGYLLAFS